MKKKTIYIILSVVAVLVLCISFFCLGRFVRVKVLEKSQIELEKSLETTIGKMKEVMKRNEEIEKTLSESSELTETLKKDNELLNDKLYKVNAICNEIEITLKDSQTTNSNVIENLNKIQKNQQIINYYFKGLKEIVDEEGAK